ncbi:MAG: hypothetical protein ABII90_03495 [Bacteroidota bacterium]
MSKVNFNKTIFLGLITYSLFIVFIIMTESVSAQNNKEIVPLNNKTTITVIAGKQHIKYYPLSSTQSTLLMTERPGRLKVFVRMQINKEKITDSICFIKYTIDDKIVKVKKIKKFSIDTNAVYEEKSIIFLPSNVKTFTIDIPPEKHKIKFLSTNPEINIDAHFKFKEAIKPVWEEIKLINNVSTETLKVIGKSKTLEYYKLTQDTAIQLKVKGPTTLRVLVRGEFQCSMYGNNVYKIKLIRNNSLLNTYKFSCKRSKTVEYEKNEELIPGSLNKIYVKVPVGENLYKFVLKDKDKSALMRFSYDKNLSEKK